MSVTFTEKKLSDTVIEFRVVASSNQFWLCRHILLAVTAATISTFVVSLFDVAAASGI